MSSFNQTWNICKALIKKINSGTSVFFVTYLARKGSVHCSAEPGLRVMVVLCTAEGPSLGPELVSLYIAIIVGISLSGNVHSTDTVLNPCWTIIQVDNRQKLLCFMKNILCGILVFLVGHFQHFEPCICEKMSENLRNVSISQIN